ncbi:hypothetical protein DL98DRAFT_604332 [Cadophora sp. DSE1049]|nr:hypothetical protein DL98DRAFT_604332 [Cadophora sp. DSE1049]
MSAIAHMYGDSGYLNRLFTNIRGENANPDPSSWTAILKRIEYNARGQTTTVLHGNGVTTERSYHSLTFRLQNLPTWRNSRAEAPQDLRYIYDPVGNVSHVHDAAQQTMYFRNTTVTLDSDYTFDPLYRLITAAGREHMGQTNGRPGGPTAPGPADMPNVDTPKCDGLHPGWKRTNAYGPGNNRLVSSSVGSATESFRYDAHGNTTALPHLPVMRWNHEDQLSATSKQVVLNGGTPETTYYVYDSAGRRIRKVTETQAGSGSAPSATIMKERIYLDGALSLRRAISSGSRLMEP